MSKESGEPVIPSPEKFCGYIKSGEFSTLYTLVTNLKDSEKIGQLAIILHTKFDENSKFHDKTPLMVLLEKLNNSETLKKQLADNPNELHELVGLLINNTESIKQTDNKKHSALSLAESMPTPETEAGKDFKSNVLKAIQDKIEKFKKMEEISNSNTKKSAIVLRTKIDPKAVENAHANDELQKNRKLPQRTNTIIKVGRNNDTYGERSSSNIYHEVSAYEKNPSDTPKNPSGHIGCAIN
jgi:hypothetical protein